MKKSIPIRFNFLFMCIRRFEDVFFGELPCFCRTSSFEVAPWGGGGHSLQRRHYFQQVVEGYGVVQPREKWKVLPRLVGYWCHLERTSSYGDLTQYGVYMGYRVHPGSKTGFWRPVMCDVRRHDSFKDKPDGHGRMMILVILSTVKPNFTRENMPFFNREPPLRIAGFVCTSSCESC